MKKTEEQLKQIEKIIKQMAVNKLLYSLDVIEIQGKYFPTTLRDVGKILNMSHEQVRYYQKKFTNEQPKTIKE